MMSLRSFHMLVEICQHEVFASKIRKITLSSIILPKDGIDDIARSFARERYAASREHMKHYVRAIDEQEHLMETGQGTSLLTEALRHLLESKIRTELEILDGTEEGSLGYHTFYRHISNDRYSRGRSAGLEMLFHAIQRSAYLVQDLSIIAECWRPQTSIYWEPRGMDLDVRNTNDLDNTRAICAGLRSFKLCYNTYDSDKHPVEMCNALLNSMCYLLSIASNAETVEIDLNPMEDCYFAALAEALSSQSLQKLVLTNVTGSENDFIHILEKHAATLQELYMDCCDLVSEGCWNQIMEWALENLNLRKISLSNLLRSEFCENNCESINPDESATGASGVRKRLQQVIEHCKENERTDSVGQEDAEEHEDPEDPGSEQEES